jgi:peptidoglycan/LPS O-acetylase OafA/YrhL
MKKNYPNLNSLRFIAATLVIISHIELYKSLYGLTNLLSFNCLHIVGKLGVNLFFVLSGFLITSLLLHEKEIKGKISIKNFFVRRILRIWPLYYLIIFLGFFIFPNIPFFNIPGDIFTNIFEHRNSSFFYYLTIFANLGVVLYGEIAYTSQTWSIATEEQFYLIWPFLFLTKRYGLYIFIILISYWMLSFILNHTGIKLSPAFFQNVLRGFLFQFKINCMAIGGVFALLTYKNSKFIQLIFSKYVLLIVSLIAISLMLFGIEFKYFHDDIYSVIFAIIIVNLACNDNYSKILENRITNYLGSISYGIYMYHGITVIVAIRIALYLNLNLVIYPITFALTFLISHFSYKYFESPFLKLKSKFV